MVLCRREGQQSVPQPGCNQVQHRHPVVRQMAEVLLR